MRTSDQGRKLLIERESSEGDAYPDPESALCKACKDSGINPLNGGYTQLSSWEQFSGVPWTSASGIPDPR